MKNLHKLLNKLDTPWVNIIWNNYYSDDTVPIEKPVDSFWWRGILKNFHTYKELTQVNVGDRRTTLLWHYRWDGDLKSEKYPELLSFAINKNITVRQARSDNPQEMLLTPVSEEALQQLHCLNVSHADYPNNDQHDRWLCLAGSHPYSPLLIPEGVYTHGWGGLDGWTHQIDKYFSSSRFWKKTL